MTQSSSMAPVFQGWNVWRVWQVTDLPFSVLMLGVGRDRQLQIWTEDQLRLNAGGAEVADPVDLKGSQIQILADAPGLTAAMRKEDVPGPAMVVNGPAELRTVRFFNKGAQTALPWPHDESYLLDTVYQPSAANAATSGPAPVTIGQTIGGSVTGPISDAIGTIPWYVKFGALAAGAFILYESYAGSATRLVRKVKTSARRIRNT